MKWVNILQQLLHNTEDIEINRNILRKGVKKVKHNSTDNMCAEEIRRRMNKTNTFAKEVPISLKISFRKK